MPDIILFLPHSFSHLLEIPINGNNAIYVIDGVAISLLVFLFWYIVPAVHAWFRLDRAVRELKKVCQKKPESEVVSKDDLQLVFSAYFFESARNSFHDTLHEQCDYQGGQKYLVSIRSTVPAEAIFSSQSLVDARLHVEFFKHLPGILTGIGIIGTFYGLIIGIQHFDPSLLAKAKTDPAQMDKLFTGLKVLFEEVQGAFIASFFAIGAAMLVTFLEKLLLNVCYRRLEQLCQRLDKLYEGGVGEDYLASLVKSSAENATQTAQLKQSLVTELSELLRELNTQQIEQSRLLGMTFAEKIQYQIESSERHGELFRAELKEGLADIGKTVASVAGGQGDAMTGMLEHLIQTFSANIQNAVGDQMTSLTEMMNSTVASMAAMQSGFKALLQDLRESGKQEREDLTAKVTSLVETLEAQQGKLESQMTAFIKAIQSQIGASQQETLDSVRANIEGIQRSVGTILINMEDERKNAVAEERERQETFTGKSKELVNAMETQVGALVTQIENTVDALNENVTVLGSISIAAINGMNESATLISSATENFAKAGNTVSAVMHKAETVSDQLSHSADSLAQASSSMDSQLSQYALTRDALARMITEMNGMLERAKQEAGVNQQLIQKMQQTVDAFIKLNSEADQSVGAISDKLAETLVKFKDDMTKHNHDFHIHHADTMEKVAGAYQPLADAIGGLNDMMAKTGRM